MIYQMMREPIRHNPNPKTVLVNPSNDAGRIELQELREQGYMVIGHITSDESPESILRGLQAPVREQKQREERQLRLKLLHLQNEVNRIKNIISEIDNEGEQL